MAGRLFVAEAAGESSINGGRGGIRTHGTLARTAVFKTAALNHSATLPHVGTLSPQLGYAVKRTSSRPARSWMNCHATRPERAPRVTDHSTAAARSASGSMGRP